MQTTGVEGIIESAVATVREASAQQTGGRWLENITVLTAPLISEWDIERCWSWAEWPEREVHFPETTNQDVGIDAVAIRRSDGEHVAVQCKARQLGEQGRGGTISKDELDKFISSSASNFWAERWLVTNGDNPVSSNVARTPGLKDKPIKVVNIASDLLQQQATFTGEECPHCEPNPDDQDRRQTKTCMQNEAVSESVRTPPGARTVGQRRAARRPSPRQDHPALRHRQDPNLPAHRRGADAAGRPVHRPMPLHRAGSPAQARVPATRRNTPPRTGRMLRRDRRLRPQEGKLAEHRRPTPRWTTATSARPK